MNDDLCFDAYFTSTGLFIISNLFIIIFQEFLPNTAFQYIFAKMLRILHTPIWRWVNEEWSDSSWFRYKYDYIEPSEALPWICRHSQLLINCSKFELDFCIFIHMQGFWKWRKYVFLAKKEADFESWRVVILIYSVMKTSNLVMLLLWQQLYVMNLKQMVLKRPIHDV